MLEPFDIPFSRIRVAIADVPSFSICLQSTFCHDTNIYYDTIALERSHLKKTDFDREEDAYKRLYMLLKSQSMVPIGESQEMKHSVLENDHC